MKNIFKKFVMVGCLMAAMMLTACGSEKIQADTLVGVDFDDVNGRGHAYINRSELKSTIEDVLSKRASKNEDISDLVNQTLKAISFEIEPNSGLSNGDIVTVSATIDNEICKDEKVEFAFNDFTIEVEGLPVVPIYTDDDLFGMLDITYTGISPDLKINLDIDCPDPDLAKDLSFKLVDSTVLNRAKGETFTVGCTADQNSPSYVIAADAELLRDFVIDNVPVYMTDASEFTDEVLQTLEPVMDEKLQLRIDNSMQLHGISLGVYDSVHQRKNITPTTVSEPKLKKVFLLTPKYGMNTNWNNILYFVYSFDLTSDSWNGFPHDMTAFDDIYAAVYAKNSIVNTDGTVDAPLYDDVKFCNFFRQGYDEFFNNEIKEANSNYDIVEVYSAD